MSYELNFKAIIYMVDVFKINIYTSLYILHNKI